MDKWNIIKIQIKIQFMNKMNMIKLLISKIRFKIVNLVKIFNLLSIKIMILMIKQKD